jgi:hypothetical protein
MPARKIGRSLHEAARDKARAIAKTAAYAMRTRPTSRGGRLIWLDHAVVARLRAMRGPGESYSDVILRIAESEGARAS